jgi:hypothetical protein
MSDPLSRSRSWQFRFWASLALLPLVSGCVAAVAIPLVAGGTLYARQEGALVRAATPAEPVAAQGVQPTQLASIPEFASGEPEAIVTDLTELPLPGTGDLAGGESPWQAFIDYALTQGAALADGARPQSALIVADGQMLSPDRRPCANRHPAVIVDLDKAGEAFSPDPGARPQAGLAAGLARLREAGIVVLWVSSLPASRVEQVAAALRAANLDPQGKDQFLLARYAEDRKQVLREEANRDVCVIAIAGDQRADFDELFDYLRDPASAIGLDVMLGQGWFLVPPPLDP